MKHVSFGHGSPRRRGAVIVLTAVTLVVILGFAALTIDVGAMYNTRSDLQRAADAGAMACAAEMSRMAAGDPAERGRAAAKEVVERNFVLGSSVTIDGDTDLQFGRAVLDKSTGRVTFVPGMALPDAVRVTVRKTKGSPNGPMSTFFAQVFGKRTVDVSASAVATLAPRDIAIVADLSGSMNDDSELRNYKDTQINLFDVWRALPPKRALPGPQPSWAALDAAPPVTERIAFADPNNPSMNLFDLPGPAWGYMKGLGFGTDLNPKSYDPTKDTGLVRLPKSSNWNVAALTSYLQGRQYSASETSAINSSANDSSLYANRVAVALGLAYWNSGQSGGQWSKRGASKGNGDNKIDNNELEWAQPLLGNTVASSATIWKDYINYVASSSTAMAQAGAFQYRFGVKTVTNFLLEKRNSHAQTPELADTPEQPVQSVKDAASVMLNMFAELETNDMVSLQIYGTSAHHESDLTQGFLDVNKRLKEMQSGYYDTYTNMGGGMDKAITELLGTRARGLSKKVMVLMSDGVSNVSESGKVGDESGGRAYSLKQARRAASLGMTIHTVSVGSGADQAVMKEIADLTGGIHFHSEGSIEQYQEELREIFGEIATRRSVELIE